MIAPELNPHIGPALQVLRIFRRLSRAEVAAALSVGGRTPVDEAYITRVEQAECVLTEAEIEHMCAVLTTPVVRVLKMASRMWQRSDLPEAELLRHALSEIEYQLWQRQQTDQA